MLARELGYTLHDLLNSLGEGELELWYELHKKQPLGNSWYQTGVIASAVANFNPWGTKRFIKPEDFMPLYREPPSPQQLYKKMLWGLRGAGCKLVDKDGKPIDWAKAK